jgi:hypothetical protein
MLSSYKNIETSVITSMFALIIDIMQWSNQSNRSLASAGFFVFFCHSEDANSVILYCASFGLTWTFILKDLSIYYNVLFNDAKSSSDVSISKLILNKTG